MRQYRSALVAGILALGVAACGDDVEIVQPTPEPPPPPPPVTATMAPASASVAVGNSVVFAVNASGGVAGDAASWTCASSNTGIATVTQTSAGCSATGVAAGDVTITASVSKSGETVNVGAQLTVTADAPPDAGDPAFLVVASITGDGPTDTSGLKGRVSVTVNVERGDQTLHALSLLVDGEAVASQSFGGAAMTPEEEDAAAEQAVHRFTLAFDSNAYEPHGDHTDVAYRNGEHMIAAELQIAGGMMSDGMMSYQTISSNVVTVVFDNDDGIVVTADLGDNSALDSQGRRWYGGPANEHIVIPGLPVSYSGEETGAVTVGLGDCKVDEDADGDDHGNGADDDHHAAEVSVEFDCEGVEGKQTITVTSTGETLNILNEHDLPEANIDMVGPTNPPMIIANRNDREDGWINAAVGIAGEFNSRNAKDNWLVKGDDETEGVGGYNMAVRIGEDLEEAVGDDAMSSLPAESSAADAYCAVAVAMDDLGNMSSLPDADDDTCREAPAGPDVKLTINVNADGTAATDTVKVYAHDANTDTDDDPNTTPGDVTRAGQTLEFGVDTTAPGIELTDDEMATRFAATPGDIDVAFDAYDDENEVGNSGLAGTSGLFASASRRTASKTECPVIGADGTIDSSMTDKDCDPVPITDEDVNLDATAVDAYYTISATAKDKAGNSSAAVGHTFVFDDAPATATAPAVPGVIAAGKSFQGASYLNDNLSIRDYYGTMNYAATGQSFGIGLPIDVDGFNAASFTRLNHAVTAVAGLYVSPTSVQDPYATVQTTQGGTAEDMASVTIRVRDQAGAYSDATTGTTTITPTDVPADSLTWVTASATPGDGEVDYSVALRGYNNNGDPTAADGYAVCGRPAGCADDDDGDNNSDQPTLKIELRTDKLRAGTFRDPIERVDFWVQDVAGVSWRIGQDASGTAGRVGGDGDNARFRTWSYSVTVPGTQIAAATRAVPAGLGTGTPMIHAVAVNSSGAALMLSSTITFGAAPSN